jgi:sensor domain CHASE-containing protein
MSRKPEWSPWDTHIHRSIYHLISYNLIFIINSTGKATLAVRTGRQAGTDAGRQAGRQASDRKGYSRGGRQAGTDAGTQYEGSEVGG